jgi:hypothetical protein
LNYRRIFGTLSSNFWSLSQHFQEHFEQENALFMVTELCDGGDFSELNHGIDDPQAF